MTAVDATQKCLDNIERHNDIIKAYITVMSEQALAEAAMVDAASARGAWQGLLAGMPVAVKDCIDVAGVPCTNGSLFFRDYVPNEDAPLVRALRRAGAVIVGKTNLHEFCYGATTQNPHFGATRNPWDIERIPGGSSGGAGAALAANMCLGAVGSDTGGSVRVPAAVNGVCGLRPTLGAISMRGSKTQLSPAIDTVGPMARSVADLARLFAVMAFYDDDDPCSVPHAWDNFLARLDDGIEGLRIGMPDNYFFHDLAPDIGDAVKKMADRLASMGGILIPVHLDGAETIHGRVMPMVWADLYAFHRERVENRPDMFGEDVLNRILLGRSVSGAGYAEAQRHREHWNRTVERCLRTVDVILTPTTPVTAPLIADSTDMLATTHRLTAFTFPFSWVGVPGLSVPCGFTGQGLPIGVQIHGRHWEEGLLFRTGIAFQKDTDWHLRHAPLIDGPGRDRGP
jgi:aspartyl-tRNA(Asn)/glutamyl-tRNA(Gln) amidotransferase subunit A